MTLVEMIIQNSRLDKTEKHYFGDKGQFISWNNNEDVWCVVSCNRFGQFTSRDFEECKSFIEDSK